MADHPQHDVIINLRLQIGVVFDFLFSYLPIFDLLGLRLFVDSTLTLVFFLIAFPLAMIKQFSWVQQWLINNIGHGKELVFGSSSYSSNHPKDSTLENVFSVLSSPALSKTVTESGQWINQFHFDVAELLLLISFLMYELDATTGFINVKPIIECAKNSWGLEFKYLTNELDLRSSTFCGLFVKTGAKPFIIVAFKGLPAKAFQNPYRLCNDTPQSPYIVILAMIRQTLLELQGDSNLSIPIWFTGHSFGAVPSALLFTRLIKRPDDLPTHAYTLMDCYTFDTPTVEGRCLAGAFTSELHMPMTPSGQLPISPYDADLQGMKTTISWHSWSSMTFGNMYMFGSPWRSIGIRASPPGFHSSFSVRSGSPPCRGGWNRQSCKGKGTALWGGCGDLGCIRCRCTGGGISTMKRMVGLSGWGGLWFQNVPSTRVNTITASKETSTRSA